VPVWLRKEVQLLRFKRGVFRAAAEHSFFHRTHSRQRPVPTTGSARIANAALFYVFCALATSLSPRVEQVTPHSVMVGWESATPAA
jgi:hypothetical protein